MDDRTAVVDALRAAGRALRLAEKALLSSPASSGPPSTAVDQTTAAESPLPPEEAGLEQFILGEATARKLYEETDPSGFSTSVAAQTNLLDFAMDRKVYIVNKGSAGVVRPESTVARTLFERMLKLLAGCKLNSASVFEPFATKPDVKNTSDIVADVDLVLMMYETPGPVEHTLEVAQLQSLVEAARAIPGSVERVVSRLKSAGVRWEPIVNAAVNPVIQLDNVEARWTACIDLHRVASSITQLLSAIDVDQTKTQSPWWVAAQAAAQIPTAVLPMIRGGETYLLMTREDANAVEDWAAQIQGWYEDQPIIIRDINAEEVLGQNLGDSMANQVEVKTSARARRVAAATGKKMSRAEVLEALKAGKSLSTAMLPALGMTMEHFLRFAQLSDAKCEEFVARAIEQLEKNTPKSARLSAAEEYSPVSHKTETDFNKISVSLQKDVERQDSPDAVIKRGLYRLSLRKDNPDLVAVYTKYDQHVGDATVADLKKAGVDLEKAGIKASASKVKSAIEESEDDELAEETQDCNVVGCEGDMECKHCGAEMQPSDATATDPTMASITKPIKAADASRDDGMSVVKNKTFLRKLNRLIKMGLLSATEVHGAVKEALRMAKVSPLVADAAADRVREALFLTEDESGAVEAKTQKPDVSRLAKKK